MLANAAPAMAQAATADAAEADDSNINEIIVTAQKREQNLQDVPISMEVVSGEKLADFNATDIKSVMNYTPNVFVQTTAGNDVIYIRRSEEHTSELQSLMRNSYAVFCLKKK